MSELAVLLNNDILGDIAEIENRRLLLTYAPAFREVESPTPLSVSMPVQVSQHTDRVVKPWLWNLLPDNERVIERWAAHYGVSKSSPFSLLGTPIGHDCPGAVRFIQRTELEATLRGKGDVEWLTEAEVAQIIRDLKRDSASWLGTRFRGQFSLAGAQAKTALLFENDRWGRPSGAIATSHILKPAVAGLEDQDLNEHLCLTAAKDAGMICVRSRLMQFEDQTAIVLDRYDREIVDGGTVRIHQEDLCQALSVPPSRKYQSEGGPGPRDIVRLLRAVMEPTAAEVAVRRFAEALAWNWIVGGTDAHAKNYSLLLSGPLVRLAPLYDIASALPYMHEREGRMAMKVGKDYDLYNYRNPWPDAAADLRLDVEWLIPRVIELATVAPDAFSRAANGADVAALNRPLAERLVDVVGKRAAYCREIAGAPRAPSMAS